MAASPVSQILYRDVDYDGPYPDSSICAKQVTISSQGTGTICQLSDGRVAKYGSHVRAEEAFNMVYVKSFGLTLIPKIYACYRIGPYQRDPADYGSVLDTFIIMDMVEGQTLKESWGTLDSTAKDRIAKQLCAQVERLRSIPPPSECNIGSTTEGPVLDALFDTTEAKGALKKVQCRGLNSC